jgi:hypothetical protein
MTASTTNEILNEMSNDKKIEMLIDQASKNQKREKKMSCSITNSESITHEKSGTKSHIMKLNQSDEKQRNKLLLDNSHSSRQIDSESDEDHFIKTSNTNDNRKEHFIKTSNTNDDLKERFTKVSNINSDLKKQAKSPDIIHHKSMIKAVRK